MTPHTTEPIRSKVHRLYVPEAIYFITSNVQDRRPYFANAENVLLLRQTMRAVKEIHPFQMRAYAFMPDHIHLLIFVLAATNISKLMQSIKRNFTRNYKEMWGVNDPVKFWQRSFYDHVIRDERDYLNHIHYIHYNPVKHGYVSRPEAYAHTSYHEYVKRGWYDGGLGEAVDTGWKEMYEKKP